LATTNHIDKIPPRIRRPGRFSSTVEVKFPTKATRLFYLNTKIPGHPDIDQWAKDTEGFSIDELKETVLAVMCLQYPLDAIVARVKANKKQSGNIQEESEEDAEEREHMFYQDRIIDNLEDDSDEDGNHPFFNLRHRRGRR